MQEEESIYNLIPREYNPPPKEKMYRSKYPSKLAPTGSTLINHTTSRPGVANLDGNFGLNKGPHSHIDNTKTFGKLKGAYNSSQADFLKKTTGTMGSNRLPESTYDGQSRIKQQVKQVVPRVSEKPIMGNKSNKNFIVSNAVENILSAPKVQKEDMNWTKKQGYGDVPQYLTQIRDNIETEYKMVQNMHLNEAEEQAGQKFCLNLAELTQLRDGLKKKWDSVNREYQSITHISTVDTQGLKRKKERCEKELQQLEKDMEKVNKQFVFVDTMR